MAISLFFAFLLALVTIFWDFIVENYVVLGTIATALAFFATAWAAWAASKSAKEAMKAVKLTRESLLEMRKASFKQWIENLLEQHDKFLEEVKSELSNPSSNINIKRNIDVLDGIYYTATANPIFIRYVNHIISILNYIDKDFYILSDNLAKRKYYVDQLRNSIYSDVMLMIAVFGINYNERRMYNQQKLNFLLNKYDFFDNELFFEKAISQTNRLDDYVSELFDRDYRVVFRNHIKHRVICNVSEFENYSYEPKKTNQLRLTHSVFWSYKSPCGDILREKFHSLTEDMARELEYNISIASEKVRETTDTLCTLIGYSICSSRKLSTRSGKYIVKDKTAVLTLLDHYLSRIRRGVNNIDLEDVFFKSTKGFTSELLGSRFTNDVDDYVYYSALLELNENPKKIEIINEIISSTNSIILDHKANLDKLIAKN
ncbi:hypothetical protein CVE53_21265 [Salmonella enterica]|uniref:hypothetical protein n=1 Tax=Citrobacter freundii TaxID=546 RepID=UPI0012703D5A|nr:hypothetical protein [Citrobacter freundii]EAN5798782.1 hypothetical protein [Salmonella enterica]EBD4719749.1 hypothetical protein [Salmonella enterica]MDQ9168615.1 hypothetical protein [Citrobacter freundii]